MKALGRGHFEFFFVGNKSNYDGRFEQWLSVGRWKDNRNEFICSKGEFSILLISTKDFFVVFSKTVDTA